MLPSFKGNMCLWVRIRLNAYFLVILGQYFKVFQIVHAFGPKLYYNPMVTR